MDAPAEREKQYGHGSAPVWDGVSIFPSIFRTAQKLTAQRVFLRCPLLGKQSLGQMGHPVRMGGDPQSVEDNGREILDLHILQGDVVDGLALDGREDPLLLVGIGAVAAAVAAVVGGDHEEGILGHAGLLAGLVDALGIAVADIDLIQMVLGAVAVSVACAVHRVKLDEQEGGLLSLHVLADAVAEGLIVTRLLGDVDAVLDDTVVDGVPVGVGAQNRVGHGVADHAEDGGMLFGSAGLGGGGNLIVVQAVDAAGHAHEHGAPALGRVRRDRSEAHIGAGTLSHNAADHGSSGVTVEVTRAVNANENHVLVVVHNQVSFGCLENISGRAEGFGL